MKNELFLSVHSIAILFTSLLRKKTLSLLSITGFVQCTSVTGVELGWFEKKPNESCINPKPNE